MNYLKVSLSGIISILLIILMFSCDLIFPVEDLVSIPGNVSATQGTLNESVTISWAGNSAQTYYVYRSTSQSGFPSKISSAVSGSSYSDTTIVPGDHYWYSVSGADLYGDNETAKSSAVEGWSAYLEAPTITTDPSSTEYSAGSTVSVTITIPYGSNVYYTKDGSDPKTSSTRIFAVSNVDLSISETTTIKAYCIQSGMESETITKDVIFKIVNNSIFIDIPRGYFTALETSSLIIKINGVTAGTVSSSDISTTASYTQFNYDYVGEFTNISFETGSFYNMFDSLSDFLSGYSESITSVSNIKKVILFAKGDVYSGDYIGTGADIGPESPWISVGDYTSNTVIITASEYESPTDLGFNIYTSTDGENFTKYNTDLIDASLIYAGYTLTGLSAETSYTINADAVYSGITSATSNNRTFTTEVASSYDSTLSSLLLSDGSISFSSATPTYSVDVSNGVDSFSVTPTATDSNTTITVNGVSVTSGASSSSVTLNEGANTFAITVTAPDNSTTTYTLTVTRAVSTSQSNDSTLSSLLLSDGSISFSSATTTYSVDVSNDVDSFSVTPTATDSNTTITVNGVSVTSGASSGSVTLNEGANTFTIVVTARDNSTTTYTLTVNRATAILWTIGNILSGEEIWYSFNAVSGTSYNIEWDDSFSGSGSYSGDIYVTASDAISAGSDYFSTIDTAYNNPQQVTTDSNEIVYLKITYYSTGTFAIRVFDENNQNVTISAVEDASNDSSLSSLGLSSGTISFDSGTSDYNVSLDNSISTFSITPTTTDSAASITVNGSSVTSGSTSGSISLSEGDNSIAIVVTAEDGSETTYTVTVVRAALGGETFTYVGGQGVIAAPNNTTLFMSSYNGFPVAFYFDYTIDNLEVQAFDGTSWGDLGSMSGSQIPGADITSSTLVSVSESDSEIVISYFDDVASQIEIQLYSGSNWNQLSTSGLPALTDDYGLHFTTEITEDGSIYAAFNIEENAFVYEWNGSSWGQVGLFTTTGGSTTSGISYVVLGSANNELYLAYTDQIDSSNDYYSIQIKSWDGSAWSGKGTLNRSNIYLEPNEIISDGSTEVYIGFETVNGANYGTEQPYNIYDISSSTYILEDCTYYSSRTMASIAYAHSKLYMTYKPVSGDQVIQSWNGLSWSAEESNIGGYGYTNYFDLNSIGTDLYWFYMENGNSTYTYDETLTIRKY